MLMFGKSLSLSGLLATKAMSLDLTVNTFTCMTMRTYSQLTLMVKNTLITTVSTTNMECLVGRIMHYTAIIIMKKKKLHSAMKMATTIMTCWLTNQTMSAIIIMKKRNLYSVMEGTTTVCTDKKKKEKKKQMKTQSGIKILTST